MDTRWFTLDRWAMKITLNMVMRNDVKTLGRETIDGLMLEGILLHGYLTGYYGKPSSDTVERVKSLK